MLSDCNICFNVVGTREQRQSRVNVMRIVTILVVFYGLCFGTTCYAADRFDMYLKFANVPVGKVFIYQKSNIDNTNIGNIAVYYLNEGEIESFKWHKGNSRATVVNAKINSNSLNVGYFNAYRLFSDGTIEPRSKLETISKNEIKIIDGGQERQIKISNIPWHSYDFDFASLGYAYRFIKDKKSVNSFNVFDIDSSQKPPKFRDFGEVTLTYLSEEVRQTKTLLKYQINGEGLENKGGPIWFDKVDYHLVGFEIQKPDERGYNSGKLVLKRIIELDKKGWQKFKMNSIQQKNSQHRQHH